MARILLVEDDPDVRPLLEHIVHAEGHRVTSAESVKIALSLLSAQPYDLVVADVDLPDGSGLTVADRAKVAGIKTLVVTGYGLKLQPGSLARYDYLLKPLHVAELIAAINRCLTRSEGNAQIVSFPKAD